MAVWIPVACSAPRSIEVVRIAARAKMPRREAFAALLEFWIWVAQEGDDGFLAGYSLSHLQVVVEGTGEDFWTAVVEEGLIVVRDDGLHVPENELLGSMRHIGRGSRPMSVQVTLDDFSSQLYSNGRRCRQPITKEQWAAVIDHFGFKCALCGAAGIPLTIEHLTPVSKGGGNEVGNIVPACESCNYSKRDLFPLEWFFSRRAN